MISYDNCAIFLQKLCNNNKKKNSRVGGSFRVGRVMPTQLFPPPPPPPLWMIIYTRHFSCIAEEWYPAIFHSACVCTVILHT